MNTLIQDIRYAIRILAKSPGFAAIAILTLALGIGANTAIFSVVDAVLMRPLPFPNSDELVSVQYFDTLLKTAHESTSYPDFFDWRSQNQVFSHITAFHDSVYTLTGVDQPAHLTGEVVTSDFFSTLEVRPQLGRGFLREEEQKGQHVVVLSESLWRSHFSGNPHIVGRSVTLNNQSYTVVGIAPRGFAFPITTPPIQLWTTCADNADMLPQRGSHVILVIGRLKAGVTVAQAQAEMSRVDASLAKQYPDTNLHFASAHIQPELQQLVGDVEPALLVLFGAVGCVLLIACANVANLLLARSASRQKEMAVRAALGAGRLRVIRQLLTESILLALFGGGLGLLLASWGTSGLVSLIPQDIPRMSQIQMSGNVFIFTLLAALLTGLLFGLAPALQSSKMNLVDSLRESGRGLAGSLHRNRLRGALVIAEVALALALLMGAGLMIQSFARIENVNPGFNPDNVLTFTFDLPDARYATIQEQIFYRQLLQRLNALPGVLSAAAAVPLPLSGHHVGVGFTIEGRPVTKGNAPVEDVSIVSAGYFHTMGVAVLDGREFTAADTPSSHPVAVVNEAFARKYFANQDPVGKRMTPDLSNSDNAPVREIIGVVGDVKAWGLDRKSRPHLFIPDQQLLVGSMSVLLRTQAAPESVLRAARDAIHSMDSSLPIYNVQTMNQYLGASVAQPRFSTLLLAIFAGLALALTALGLYGVVSYSVTQRTHEIGIRMALGAKPADVLSMVIRQGLTLALIGLVIGIAAAFGVTRLLSSMIFGVTPYDPTTFVIVAAILIAVAFAACYIPARRAMKVDPMVALRYE